MAEKDSVLFRIPWLLSSYAIILVWFCAFRGYFQELDEEATHKKYLLVRQEGKRQVQRDNQKASER